jgi:hypothetical protein
MNVNESKLSASKENVSNGASSSTANFILLSLLQVVTQIPAMLF